MISSFDDEGRQLSGVVVVWTSDLKPDEYKDVMTGGVRIHQEVDVPATSTSLRIGVEDDATGRLGTLELPLPVPAPADVPRIAKRALCQRSNQTKKSPSDASCKAAKLPRVEE